MKIQAISKGSIVDSLDNKKALLVKWEKFLQDFRDLAPTGLKTVW